MHLWTKNEVKICEKVLNNLGQLMFNLTGLKVKLFQAFFVKVTLIFYLGQTSYEACFLPCPESPTKCSPSFSNFCLRLRLQLAHIGSRFLQALQNNILDSSYYRKRHSTRRWKRRRNGIGHCPPLLWY